MVILSNDKTPLPYATHWLLLLFTFTPRKQKKKTAGTRLSYSLLSIKNSRRLHLDSVCLLPNAPYLNTCLELCCVHAFHTISINNIGLAKVLPSPVRAHQRQTFNFHLIAMQCNAVCAVSCVCSLPQSQSVTKAPYPSDTYIGRMQPAAGSGQQAP